MPGTVLDTVLGTAEQRGLEGAAWEGQFVWFRSQTIDKATHGFHIEREACEQCLAHRGLYGKVHSCVDYER